MLIVLLIWILWQLGLAVCFVFILERSYDDDYYHQYNDDY